MHDDLSRLDSSLELVEPHLHPALVHPESLTRIRRVAHALPIFAVGFFGFECRLGAQGGPTDCALSLTPDGARMLAGRHPSAPPAELQTGTWPRIRRFYQEWGDTRSTPYTDAACTWLELDTGEDAQEPNLLFGYWPRATHIQRPVPWLLDRILPMLFGGPIPPGLRATLSRCLEARPAEDFQIGVMLSRALGAVRLCVFDVPPEEAPDYLHRLGWTGPIEEVRRYLDLFQPHADFIGLHLDVGERIFPHIGLEPGFTAGPWARQPHLEPRWHGQLGQLVELELCTREERAALLAWVGYQRQPGESEEVVLLRGLSHVKLVLRPGAGPAAKAYFGIAHRTAKADANVAA
jgi:hypothetical protein